MTEKMIAACVLAGCLLLTAAVFIRHAALYRRRLRGAESAPGRLSRPLGTVRCDAYRLRFLLSRGRTFASRKTVRIRPEYYERLSRITAQYGGLSLIAYVDNVLRAHFEDYGESIDRCCRQTELSNGTK
mgnify:CR=1 FL=1